MGVALAQFVLPAAIAEQLPVAMRAAGVGLAFGVATAAVGGTAPLLANLTTRSGTDEFIPAYALVWASLAFLTAVRWPAVFPDAPHREA